MLIDFSWRSGSRTQSKQTVYEHLLFDFSGEWLVAYEMSHATAADT